MRWLITMVCLVLVVVFIAKERRGMEKDLKMASSALCLDGNQLTGHNEAYERCRLATHYSQLDFSERLQERAQIHFHQLWHFISERQFLKAWYLQLLMPFVLLYYLYLSNDARKERMKQEIHYKIFHENLVHTEHREQQQQELFDHLFALYKRNLSHAPRLEYAQHERIEAAPSTPPEHSDAD